MLWVGPFVWVEVLVNARQTPEPPTRLRWWHALRSLDQKPIDPLFRVPEKSHQWGFGAFVLSFSAFLVTSVMLEAIFRPQPGKQLFPLELVTVLSLPALAGAAVAVMMTVLRGNGPIADLRIRWHWPHVGFGLMVGALALVPTLFATQMWASWVGKNATSAVGKVLDGIQMSPLLAVLIFIHLWLIGPLCEEIVYRGLLWGAIERLGWGRWTAFALTTAIFALAHLEPERTPLLLIISIPMGLARLYTGGLLASIVVHQVNNLLPALGMLLLMTGVMPA